VLWQCLPAMWAAVVRFCSQVGALCLLEPASPAVDVFYTLVSLLLLTSDLSCIHARMVEYVGILDGGGRALSLMLPQ
jgi:hypothetical protein